MYQSLLFAHSWLRWLVLILFFLVIIQSLVGLNMKRTYSPSDKSLVSLFVNSIRLQFLIGLILYLFLSPFVKAAFRDIGAAMKTASLRFWAVEHVFAMLVAIALVEIGASKTKKALSDKKKFRTQLIFFTIALLAVLSSIPFNESVRLFRGF